MANRQQERSGMKERIVERRTRFADAVSKLGERATSGDLLKLLVLPGAIALFTGFGAMFLGWYGASRTAREIEQIPYLISGGLIGLGLVFIGGLLLATAMWTSQLQRFSERSETKRDEEAGTDTAEIRIETPPSRGPARRRRAPARRSGRARP